MGSPFDLDKSAGRLTPEAQKVHESFVVTISWPTAGGSPAFAASAPQVPLHPGLHGFFDVRLATIYVKAVPPEKHEPLPFVRLYDLSTEVTPYGAASEEAGTTTLMFLAYHPGIAQFASNYGARVTLAPNVVWRTGSNTTGNIYFDAPFGKELTYHDPNSGHTFRYREAARLEVAQAGIVGGHAELKGHVI